MIGVVLPLLVVGLVLGAAVAVEWSLYQRRIRQWQTVELRFGRDLAVAAVEGLLAVIGGLPARRLVALEAEASEAGISYRLATDQATLDTLRAQLRAKAPSTRLAPVAHGTPANWRYGLSIRRLPRGSVLATDNAEPLAHGLIGALQPLGKDERVLLRWLLTPSAPRAVPDASTAESRPLPDQRISGEHRRLLRSQNAGPVVAVRGLLAVASGAAGRQRHLGARVVTVLRTCGTAYGRLHFRPVLRWRLLRRVTQRYLLLADRYSPAELAGLLAWPLGNPPLPGLTVGTSPLLMPSRALPRSGRVFGTATWPGAARPIAQPVIGGLSHTLISGPTGVGKSALLTNLLLGDIAAGNGGVLIDGKGDTYEAVLSRLPKDRTSDVITLDCTTSGPVPGLTLFTSDAPQLTADVVLGVLSDLFQDSWGPLSERYLRAALVAVAHDSKATLAELPYVFTDPAVRRRAVGRVKDPLTIATFAALDAMKPAEQLHQLSAPLNKLGIVLGRPTVRAVLGQQDGALDFRRVLASRQIALINLNPARIGSAATRLLAALIVYALFQATLGRIDRPVADRRPRFVYLDEPKALGDLPMPLGTLLEQARGLGVGLTLAPQSVSQLPPRVRDAVLTNVATRVGFRLGADDARLMARDLSGVEPEQLGDLGQFEAVARIGLGSGAVAAPVTLRTEPLPPAVRDGRALGAAVSDRLGRTPEQVDADISSRHHLAGASGPVGRTKRGAA